jgi:hypothetical protein
VVDPNSNGILFFGAGAGKGLWKSTNFGVTWQVSWLTALDLLAYRFFFSGRKSRVSQASVSGHNKVEIPLQRNLQGTYAPDPTDSSGYNSALI